MSMDDSVDTARLGAPVKATARSFRHIDVYAPQGEGKFLLDPEGQLFSIREAHLAKPARLRVSLGSCSTKDRPDERERRSKRA